MSKVKLTKRAIDGLEPNSKPVTIRDAELELLSNLVFEDFHAAA